MATDHSRGYPPATTASFRTGIPKIHHNKCGGRLARYTWDGKWECLGCQQVWKLDTIEAFDDAAIEIRFHLRGDIDPTEYAIVWVTEGKHEFTRTVPVAEAHKYKRWKP